MTERIETIAAGIAEAMSGCRKIGGRWTVETAIGVIATLRNEGYPADSWEPRQAIRLRLERGRLHVSGAYTRPADNGLASHAGTPYNIERPSITMDPARDPAGIVRRDVARRFWRRYCQALAQTIEANRRRELAEARRWQAMERLAHAGSGTVSRSFGELVTGPCWKAGVGTDHVQTLELDRLDVETACAVLELVAGRA